MFTGIVTAIGTIESAEQRGDLRVVVACPFDPEAIDIGASIACGDIGLASLDKAHGRWTLVEQRQLGS
ncbi:hypothetical protein P8R33_05215, partial [Qipengyuania sp. XHP0211]|nr:hypothetical protein [Qipengyuania sp. XHP0211]